MEKYIVGVVLMDKNGKTYCWCYFDVKILTTFCIDIALMIRNVRAKSAPQNPQGKPISNMTN